MRHAARRSLSPALAAFASIVLAAGCPRAAAPPGGGGAGATPSPSPAASARPWRPLPKAVPLAAGDVACVSDRDCPDGLHCKTPEQSRWNDCGAPREPDCGSGWIGDECGNCFLRCEATAGCPMDMTCLGGMCQSPARCVRVRPPPP